MNFTENFQEFSSKLSRTDLALYAGIGIVLWVMFKDRMSPVQQYISDLLKHVKTLTGKKNPVVSIAQPSDKGSEDVFFQLVSSWKQTRDLAVKSNCAQAVKVADQMFPFLSPSVCKTEEVSDDK